MQKKDHSLERKTLSFLSDCWGNCRVSEVYVWNGGENQSEEAEEGNFVKVHLLNGMF